VQDRLRVRRQPKRASYDSEAIRAVLDEALVCHVGFAQTNGGCDQPFVIPTAFSRAGDRIYVHAARTSRLAAILRGAPVCVEVTLLDGLVMARSAFHHSMNYRSVIAFGVPAEVDGAEKLTALEALVEKVAPGRWPDIRQPSDKELHATAVCALDLSSAVLKQRTGGPIDDPEDMSLRCWAGIVPLSLEKGIGIED
jgi:nitroimidazol reductase NimA-like FMN-containing flavoprotein (pyridoxamine 5'-phosphate oxidase superfamily)